MEERWLIEAPPPQESILPLARELKLPPAFASILVRRGFDSCVAAETFLQPRLADLSDPFLLPEMDRAVERLFAALDRREDIILYGDYDVDGVASLAMLQRLLTCYGGRVRSFIPKRMDEGYGLSEKGLERCLTSGRPGLFVAIDCGTTSVEPIARLREAGFDVLVFDHHECPETLPACTALVNPKRGDDFHYLCSAGVIFKLSHALLKTRPLPDFDLRDFLDLTAMATIADLVPLIKENRTLVLKGAQRLAQSRWPGVRALAEAGKVHAPVRPVDISFRIAPKINAAGRMENAQSALDLLMTDDPRQATRIAAELTVANVQRQEVESGLIEEAEARVARDFDPLRDVALVLGERGWHPGVIGIVASRICRRYHRPTMVVGFDETGQGKGSGRSVPGFCLVTALGACREFLETFGGHELAAGISLNEMQFPHFRRQFLETANQTVELHDLRPTLPIEGEIRFAELNLALLASHERLQPFGMGNRQPTFIARGVAPNQEPRLLRNRHLLFDLRQEGHRHPAIFFQAAHKPLPRPPWDIAFRIEPNVFRDRLSLQVQIQSIRHATAD